MDVLAGQTLPTPVERMLSTRQGALWVKRDDQTHPVYGGNKVRKLARILQEIGDRKEVLTVGAAGSHHVLATTVFASKLGLSVRAVMVPQPTTPHVEENLRAAIGLGLKVIPTSGYMGAGLALMREKDARTFYIPVGGSSPSGALGYVDAVHELAQQVEDGMLARPDLIVVALGSGGTAAGIIVGLRELGWKTRVLAVGVTEPAWASRYLLRRLVQGTCAALGKSPFSARDFGARVQIDRNYLGAGYGHATPEGKAATERAKEWSLPLEATYTAKTFAAALAELKRGEHNNLLYWHTYSSAPMAPLLKDAPSEVPEAVRKILCV